MTSNMEEQMGKQQEKIVEKHPMLEELKVEEQMVKEKVVEHQ